MRTTQLHSRVPAAPHHRAALRRPVRCAGAPAVAGQLSVTLKRPLGIVFAERVVGQRQGVYVEELVAGGNAELAGVRVGDVLSRCSATVLKDGKEEQFESQGYGATPYTNWNRIMFDAQAQSFDDVMGAISSNNPRWGILDVAMEFTRGGAAASTASTPAPAPVSAAPNTLVEAELVASDGAVTAAVVAGEPKGTVRDLLRAQGIQVYNPWGQAMNCNGAGQCGLCAVAVVAGADLLTERTAAEGKHLKGKPDTWRLGCQSCVAEGAVGKLRVQAQPKA